MAVPVTPALRLVFYVLTCVVFAGILFVRGGPNPAETDAHAVTFPATDISHGELRLAEAQTSVPNPPGYPLLTAPLVLVLRPWVGAPRWCDDKPIPKLLLGQGSTYYRTILGPCDRALDARGAPVYPVWYRSQAVLTVTAWLVLLAGAVMLLRAAGGGGGIGEFGLAAGLLVLPGTTDAVAQSFHPQDIMCVGFSCAGVAQALRRRWVAVGVLFGLAFLCKQFALLGLIAVTAAAPGWRARAGVVLPAAVVVGAGVIPFLVADRTATLHALSAVYVSGVGVEKTPTMVGMLGVAEQTKLELARDLPIAAAAGLAAGAWRRARGRLLEPGALVALVLACTAMRLVFEVSILDYYFLAVGAGLIVLDIVRRRPPWWALGWVVAARYGLTWVAPRAPLDLTAVLFLALSLAPAVLGLVVVARTTPAPDAPVSGVRSAIPG